MTRAFLIFTCIAATSFGQSFLSKGLSRFSGADNSTYTGDNGTAYYAAFPGATAVATDSAGNLYVLEATRVALTVGGEFALGAIREIDTHGIVTTPASQVSPGGIAIDSRGNIYFSQNQQTIQRINANGTLTAIAGSGSATYNGEGVAALAAGMAPSALAVDANGLIYFADPANRRIRMLGADGSVHTVAGTGLAGNNGEGGPAVQAAMTQPSSLAFDPAGNLYVADANRVVKIDTHGTLTRFAGNGIIFPGPLQSGVPATHAPIIPFGVATDAAGDVFVAAGPILKITPDGILHSFAGPLDGTGSSLNACGNVTNITLSIGSLTPLNTIGADAEALFAGNAPGFVGLTQINVQVPAAAVGGGALTVAITSPSLYPQLQGSVTLYVAP